MAAAALPETARAGTTLDASFECPYAPHPVIGHPSSWFVYRALIPGVVMPYDVVVSNRKLGPLPNVGATPDLRDEPSDLTMLLLFLRDPMPIASFEAPNISEATVLNGRTMRFADLGGGHIDWQGFREFLGWYVATSGDTLHSMATKVYVGPDAPANDWQTMQSIVDSIRLPS